MPNVGAIYKFISAKVAANTPKPKYHVAIDFNCGFFLFINSDDYAGAMKIERHEWPEMPKLVSFISCSAGIRYRKSDFKGITIEASGNLTNDCLLRLRQHIFESEVMPQMDINIAIAALDKWLA